MPKSPEATAIRPNIIRVWPVICMTEGMELMSCPRLWMRLHCQARSRIKVSLTISAGWSSKGIPGIESQLRLPVPWSTPMGVRVSSTKPMLKARRNFQDFSVKSSTSTEDITI